MFRSENAAKQQKCTTSALPLIKVIKRS